jgi:site-specific DNA-methyltransferase (adenine-specific)
MAEDFYSAEGIGFSSERGDWATPIKFFAELNEEFNFTLDAAAMQRSTKVPENWYGLDHPDEKRRDCFQTDWLKDSRGGWVFMNPPYGKEMRPFLKLATEWNNKGVKQVWLLPSYTGAIWFHTYCMPHQVRYVKGKLNFDEHKNQAPFYSALIILDDKP